MYAEVTKSQEEGTATAAATNSAQALTIQRSLAIGAIDDPLEREADEMADSVMRMSEPAIQRKCAHCEEEEQVNRKPLASFIQKKSVNAGNIASVAISSRIQSVRKVGNPLPENTKKFMESRFGTDFSHVRIHSGSEATALSNELSAQAFTVGNHIYFNQGKYETESSEGKRLLAHELTHTVQQSGKANTKRIQRDDLPPGTLGTGVLRINGRGRVEFIAGTPDLPLIGSIGVGFRCENGRCQPLGGQNPFMDSSKSSYTLDEARNLLSGVGRGLGTSSGGTPSLPRLGNSTSPNFSIFHLPCPPGQQRSRFGLCESTLLPRPTPTPGQLNTGLPGLFNRPFSALNPYSSMIDHFTQGSANLPANSTTIIVPLVMAVNALPPGVIVHIDGHASMEGTASSNTALSQERATNVKNQIVSLGVTDAHRLHTTGKGEAEPLISPENSEEDRAQNRRVEIWYFDNSSALGFHLNIPSLQPTTH